MQVVARAAGASTAPVSRAASGPSAATTTAPASRRSPPASVTPPRSTDSTVADRRTAASVRLSANWRGIACMPAAGMQAIPRQLAESLTEAAVRLSATVESVDRGGVTLAGGERLEAGAVVVAADGPEAARLTGAVEAPAARATTCIYFAAERSPLGEPILVLDGEGRGPVNDLCV